MALWMSGQARRLKAGEYRFDQADDAARRPRKDRARGRLRHQPHVSRGLDGRRDGEDLRVARVRPGVGVRGRGEGRGARSDALDPAARDLEGYLFPETYALSRHTDAPRLVRLMVDRFEHVFTPEMKQAAEARGLTVRQAVAIASIVEKETARPEERRLVAAVYENRLRIGMALQCDPTVIYALEQAGKYTGNLRRDDLAFDSPYNTYRYPGLPPGPDRRAGKSRRSKRPSIPPTSITCIS